MRRTPLHRKTRLKPGDKPLQAKRRPAWPARVRAEIEARDGGRCQHPGCYEQVTMPPHHIVFVSQGGPGVAQNGVLLCAKHHTGGNECPHRSAKVRRWWEWCAVQGLLGEQHRAARDEAYREWMEVTP